MMEKKTNMEEGQPYEVELVRNHLIISIDV